MLSWGERPPRALALWCLCERFIEEEDDDDEGIEDVSEDDGVEAPLCAAVSEGAACLVFWAEVPERLVDCAGFFI